MPSKRFLTLLLLAGLCTWLPRPVAATAIANSNLSFSSLTITFGTGSLSLDDLWLAQAVASANNSLGESDAQFNFAFSPGTTSATAAATWATAGAAATALGDPPDLDVSGGASSNLNIPGTGGIPAAAFATGIGNVSNLFTLSGSGMVAVDFSVDISGNLNVFTDGGGLEAFAETIFNLEVDGNPVLLDDRMFDIGPSSAQAQSFSAHLTNMVLLDAGVSHFLILQADSESRAQAPEPASSALLALGLGALLWRVRRSTCDQATGREGSVIGSTRERLA